MIMNKLKKIGFIGAVMFVLVFSSVAEPDVLSLDKALINLTSQDEKERKKAVDNILKERQRIIEECQTIAQKCFDEIESLEGISRSGIKEWTENVQNIDTNKKIANAAVYLLGALRSEEAIPFLINNMSYDGCSPIEHLKPLYISYPCAAALIEIGMPSLEPVLKNAGSVDDEGVSYLSAVIVKKILGKGRK